MKKNQSLDAVILIDKPQGWTSTKTLSVVKRKLGVKKAGHTGTLDPLATGVLPICLGQATKIAQFLIADDKIYKAQMKLGTSTDTDDSEGSILETKEIPPLSREQVEAVLQQFQGNILQRPPIYSALKIKGQRAYDLARSGQNIQLEERPITIHQLTLEEFAPPFLSLHCHVSKGTYIRALVRDIALALGTVGHLTALRRIQSGPFSIEQTLPPQQIDTLPSLEPHLITLADALQHLPTLIANPQQTKRLLDGLIPHSFPPPKNEQTGLHRVLSHTGQLIAILEPQNNSWHFKRVFRS